MNNTKVNRVEWIDVAKGIAIILMILGHCISIDSWFRLIIFSFHMPFFLIVSGYFYKRTNFKIFIKKQVQGLLIPYCIAITIEYTLKIIFQNWPLQNTVITGFFSIITGLSYTSKISYVHAVGTGVLWFLPMLFCVRLIFYLVEKYLKEKNLLIATVVIFLVLTGYWLGKAGYWLPYSLDVALYSLIFYFLGFTIKRFNISEIIFKDFRYGIIICLIWIFGVYQRLVLELATRYYPGILTCIVIALSGTIVFFYVSYFISKIKVLKNLFIFYGRGTIFIFAIHHLEWVFIPYNKISFINNNGILFLCKLIVITFIYIIIKIINRTINKFEKQ